MKHLYFLLALCGALSPTLSAQTLTYARTYGGTRYDDARSLADDDDGCTVFTGLSKSGPDSLGDLYLSKVNAAGAVLWTQYYGRPEEDGGNSVIRTSDGGYLMVGHTALSYGEECDGFLVRTDADGKELWRALVGGALDDVCLDAVEMEDGSFIAVGRAENAETRTFRVLFAKISATGKQIFFRQLATDLPSYGLRIARSTDGNLLVAGYSHSTSARGTEMLVLKCSPEGQVLWHTNFGTDLNDRAYALAPMPDGGCTAVGGGADPTDRVTLMAAIRLDANGTIIASNTQLAAPGMGHLYSIVRTRDGRLAVAGVLQQSSEDFGRPVLGMLNDDLSVSGWQTAGLPAGGRTRGLLQDAAGNFMLCGNSPSPQGTSYDIFLAKMPLAPSTSGAEDVAQMPYLLFPNPFREYTYLKIGEAAQAKTLVLSTLDGKEVRHMAFDAAELFLYRNGLQPGQYVFAVRDGAGKLLVSGKLAVE